MHASISFLRKGSGLQDKNEKSALSGNRKCGSIWRRRWDSNPRDVLPSTRFRVELVMTTSILLHVRACSYRRLFIISETLQKDKSFFRSPAKFLSDQERIRQISSLRILGQRSRACDLTTVVYHDRGRAAVQHGCLIGAVALHDLAAPLDRNTEGV